MTSPIGIYQGVIPNSGGLRSIAYGNPPVIYTGFLCLASKIDEKRKIAEELAKKANIYFALRPAYEDILTSQHSDYNAFNQGVQTPGATDPIYVCRYHNKETSAILNATEITDLDAKIRIQLLFQYIYAMHQVYTQYGRQATNCKIQVVQLRSSQSAVLDIRRREQLYDRFTVPAMNYQILLTLEELDKAPEKADTGYRLICALLFPLTPTPTPPFLKEFLDDLKGATPTWAPMNDYPWGPCMLLFYPLFTYTNDDLRPQVKQAGDVATIEDGYLKSPFGTGEKAALKLDDEIAAAKAVYNTLQEEATQKNYKPELKALYDLYMNTTIVPQAATILADVYNKLHAMYKEETTNKVAAENGDLVTVYPIVKDGTLQDNVTAAGFSVTDKLRIQFYCGAIVGMISLAGATIGDITDPYKEDAAKYTQYGKYAENRNIVAEKTLTHFNGPEYAIKEITNELSITGFDVNVAIEAKNQIRRDYLKKGLNTTIQQLVTLYGDTIPATDPGTQPGTKVIQDAYAMILDKYGDDHDVFSDDGINLKIYIENSRLITHKSTAIISTATNIPLPFAPWSGAVGYYTYYPNQIKNAAWILLEIIAHIALSNDDDTTRPSVPELTNVVNNERTITNQQQQTERIEFLKKAFAIPAATTSVVSGAGGTAGGVVSTAPATASSGTGAAGGTTAVTTPGGAAASAAATGGTSAGGGGTVVTPSVTSSPSAAAATTGTATAPAGGPGGAPAGGATTSGPTVTGTGTTSTPVVPSAPPGTAAATASGSATATPVPGTVSGSSTPATATSGTSTPSTATTTGSATTTAVTTAGASGDSSNPAPVMGPGSTAGVPGVAPASGPGAASGGSTATTPGVVYAAPSSNSPTMQAFATATKLPPATMYGNPDGTFVQAFDTFKATHASKMTKLGLKQSSSATDILQLINNDPYRQGGLLHAMQGAVQDDKFAVIRGLSMAKLG
jgi:hypothetical protein